MDMELRQRAQAWLDEDPDPKTRAETELALKDEDETVLREHFASRLEFGTAGLRGELGFGPARMNRVIIRKVSKGLGMYLEEQFADAHERGVVIGYDHRHNSDVFARDTAEVMGTMGFKVWLSDTRCATPQLAYALKHLGCAAGVMVTASHNPPRDNGYKVYWANGAQIIPPHDKGISACIDRVGAFEGVRSLEELREAGVVLSIPATSNENYIKEVDALRCYNGPTDIKIVYTAMHGVGRAATEPLLRSHGYNDIEMVAEQVEPDPDFPTVNFPNPEEPGALDMALAKANAVKADVLIANDPDADRLAVAVPDDNGGFMVLSGNQVGALLGDELLRYGHQKNGAARMVATTIVSSQLLSSIAKAHGATCAETLTGFKWLGNRGKAWMAEGGQFVMGYEEALGYSLGEIVPDKDGVDAALLFCDLVARCKSQGITVKQRLAALYKEHGLHLASQKSVKFLGLEGPAKMADLMNRLRNNPPKDLAGYKLLMLRDYQKQISRDFVNNTETTLDLPTSNVLGFHLDGGGRILVRPSGTEPKVKFYFEVKRSMENESEADCEKNAKAQLDALTDAITACAGV